MPDSLAGAKRLTAAKRAVPAQRGPAFCKPCAAQYIEGRHKATPDKNNKRQRLPTIYKNLPQFLWSNSWQEGLEGEPSLLDEALKHKSQLRNTTDFNETPANQTFLKEDKAQSNMNIGSHTVARNSTHLPSLSDEPPPKKTRREPIEEVDTLPSTSTISSNRATLFVDSDTQVHALLAKLQQISPTVALVMSPDDMNQDGLRKNLTINDDGTVAESPGRLFVSEADQPVILVLDFRHFEPRQLSSLNSLFDNPPTLDGQPLGSHLSIISLVDDTLFPDHVSQTYKPGNDFSRRIAPGFKQGTLWHETLHALPEKSHSVTDVVNQKVPDLTTAGAGNSGKTVRPIDLSGQNWREVLFGQACVNTKGQRCYLPGQLALARPGETLVLKGAPWKDPAFEYALYKLIHSGSYYANGGDHRLPDNISWARLPLTAEDIALLKQAVKRVPEPSPRMAIINEDTQALVTCQSRFDRHGSLTGHDTFAHWLADCEGIRVTSPLNTNQWFELLRAIQKLGKPAPVPVYLDTPAQQPLPFKESEQTASEEFCATVASPQSGPLTGNSHVTLTRGDDAFLRQGNAARDMLMDTGTVASEILNIVITPELRLSSLVEDLRLVSLKKAEFQRREQPFLQALREGRKLRIRGLENNTTLARQVESLLLSPPSLLVNGERETFPRAQIDVIWPEGAKTDSVLWQQAQDLGGLSSSGQTLEELKAWLQEEFGLSNNDSDIADTVARLQDITSRLAPPGQQFQLGTDLLTKLVIQARLEQKLTSADALESAHWSKAINSVLLKKYRSNPDLYNLLRLAVRSQLQNYRCDWIDRIALKRWLEAHPNPDAACIQKHFWSLTRYVSHTAINQLPEQISTCVSSSLDVEPQSNAFKLMAGQVRQAAGHNNQDDTVLFLDRHLCIEKQLQDVCYELGQHKRHEDIERMGQLIGTVIQSRQSKAEKQRAIEFYLTLFQFAPHNCALIAKTLVNPDDAGNWKHWYKRRETRLLEKVKKHPVTLISGEPGAGKSFMAAKVATALQGGGRALTLCCGPMTRLSDLMIKESLVTDPLTGDAEVKREDGPLLQWAKSTATAQHPAVLVIDEANLVDPTLWNCLKGLYETPVSISDQHGHPWPVSEHHRIIMTGNPTSMTGRHLNAFLQNRAPELYYRPLNDNFMASQIVDPVLQTLVKQVAHQCPGVSTTEQVQLTNRLSLATISLFNQYRHLILEHEFSPRDLTDFCERLLRYLDSASQKGLATCLQQHRPQEQEKALTGLIWQAMADSLSGLVPTSHRWNLDTLKTWYQVTYGADAALVEPHQLRFDYFFQRWQAQSGAGPGAFNLDNASVKALSRQVWLELDRLQARRQKPQEQIKGRCATVIEGPAGRGKDDLLKRLIHEWNRQQRADDKEPVRCHAISLDPNHPDAFYRTLQQASKDGEIMVGSEMNLLKSQYHEGQMNDLLTGASTPGFHLFATVNPATFAGRHPLSTALQSRCNLVTLGDYSRDDLEKIAATLFPDQQLADKVARWHWLLLEQLRANEIPQHPSVADMKELAAACADFPLIHHRMDQMSITPAAEPSAMDVETLGEQQTRTGQETALKKRFEQQYGFYLHFLARKKNARSLSLDDVLAAPVSQIPDHPSEVRNYSAWTAWVHTRIPALLTRPVSVVAGCANTYDATAGIITLKKDWLEEHGVQDDTIKRAIVRLFAHEQWQRHLPLVSPFPDDILFCAAYHFWQQKSFEHYCADYPEWAQQAQHIFPLSEEESASLKLTSNASYLDALTRLAALKPSASSLALLCQALLTNQNNAGSLRTISDPAPPRPVEMTEDDRHPNTRSPVELTEGDNHPNTRSPVELTEGDNHVTARGPVELTGNDNHARIRRDLAAVCQDSVHIDNELFPVSHHQPIALFRSPAPCSFTITRYFNKTEATKTRMGVSQVVLQGEQILTKAVAPGSMGYEVIKPAAGIESTVPLGDDTGAFTVHISPEEAANWKAVPGIAPHQKILALSVTPAVELEVLRDRATHQHFIRPVDSEFYGRLDIQILVREQPGTHLDASRYGKPALPPAAAHDLCAALRPLFEQDAAPLAQKLRTIRNLTSIPEQCKQLERLCRDFNAAPHSPPCQESRFSLAHLEHMLKHQYGECHHRALCFHVMATWLGIPSRIVKAEAYTWVESSWDGGHSWHTHDLGNLVHPQQRVHEQPTAHVHTTPGLTLSPACNQQLLKVASKDFELVKNALQVSHEQLDTWIRHGGHGPVPCGLKQCQPGFTAKQASVDMGHHICDNILDSITATETPDTDALDLTLLLYPVDQPDQLCTVHSTGFLFNFVQQVMPLARKGQYCLRLLCQTLTTMAASVTTPELWKRFEQDIEEIVLDNVGCDEELNTVAWTDADWQMATFVLLENNWIAARKALERLHQLAQSDVYGEHAKRKLDAWYDGLNQKLDLSQRPPVTPRTLAAQLPANLGCAGRSRTLESRLRVGGAVRDAYGWAVSDHLDANRLIRQQAFFREGAESVSLPPVVMVGLLNRKTPERQQLERFHVPLTTTGAVDTQQQGKEKHVPSRAQNRKAFQSLVSKWELYLAHFHFADLNRPDFDMDAFMRHWANTPSPSERAQLEQDILAWREEFVIPQLQLSATSTPLLDVIQAQFFEYLYTVMGAERGNVKVLSCTSAPAHPDEKTRNEEGFFQPQTLSQWHAVHNKESGDRANPARYITPELLQRNGRFDQALVINAKEMNRYWREFVASLDLTDAARYCITVEQDFRLRLKH